MQQVKSRTKKVIAELLPKAEKLTFDYAAAYLGIHKNTLDKIRKEHNLSVCHIPMKDIKCKTKYLLKSDIENLFEKLIDND